MRTFRSILIGLAAIIVIFSAITISAQPVLTSDIASISNLWPILDGKDYLPDSKGFRVLIIPSSIEGLEYKAYKHITKNIYGFAVTVESYGTMLIHWQNGNWFLVDIDGSVDMLDIETAQENWTVWVEAIKKNGDLNNIHSIPISGGLSV